MEDISLQEEKLDPILKENLQKSPAQVLPVIIQTTDGLKEEDKEILRTLGGKLKDDLYIINAFSAELPAKALASLVLSPRVTRIYYDAEIQAIEL